MAIVLARSVGAFRKLRKIDFLLRYAAWADVRAAAVTAATAVLLLLLLDDIQGLPSRTLSLLEMVPTSSESGQNKTDRHDHCCPHSIMYLRPDVHGSDGLV